MTTYAESVLPVLRELPAPLAALLLQQAQRYEVMFPREQQELAAAILQLRAPRTGTAQEGVDSFGALKLPASDPLLSWERQPSVYLDRLTAWMWSSGQIAEFRHAAQLLTPDGKERPDERPRAIVIVYDAALVGKGGDSDLFRRLRPAGTLHTHIDGTDAAEHLRLWTDSRVQKEDPYAQWFLSGAKSSAWPMPGSMVRLGYDDLRPARLLLLSKMNRARYEPTGGGPEGLRSEMLAMRAQEMGMQEMKDPVLQAFVTDVLVGGSGTQLYPTTFVQWSIREVLRRARPCTLVAHFAPRNSSASMDVRLSNPEAEPPLDPAGSLVDAEMHTYMTYVNLLRLPAAEKAFYLVWHPGYRQALQIGPGVARGGSDPAEKGLSRLLAAMA